MLPKMILPITESDTLAQQQQIEPAELYSSTPTRCMLHLVRCNGMHVQDIVCSYSLAGHVAVSTFIKPTLQYRCYLLVLQGL